MRNEIEKILKEMYEQDMSEYSVEEANKETTNQILALIEGLERQARIDEWNLISETLHSAGIQAELFLNKTRKDRIQELEREE